MDSADEDVAAVPEPKPEFKAIVTGRCINLPAVEVLRAIYASLPDMVPRDLPLQADHVVAPVHRGMDGSGETASDSQ